MKSAQSIVDALKSVIDSMLLRPLMYGDSPLSFEATVLTLIELYRFSINDNKALSRNNDWQKFVKEKLGNDYNSSWPVSRYLKATEQLDDTWTQLSNLLREFYNIKIVEG